MTQQEQLAKQGININALVPVEVPGATRTRQTSAFRERDQYWAPRWSWNKTNNKA